MPSNFRVSLKGENTNELVLFRSTNEPCIEGVSMNKIEALSKQMDHFDFLSGAQNDLATVLFAESVQLNFDKDGRITLPKDFIEYAGLDDEIAFVGLGSKFQIWAPAKLETRKQQARQNVIDQKLTIPTKKKEGGDDA